MAGNYIPTADAACATFAATLAGALTADPTAYGMVAADATAV